MWTLRSILLLLTFGLASCPAGAPMTIVSVMPDFWA
jgi:hypothetical protein